MVILQTINLFEIKDAIYILKLILQIQISQNIINIKNIEHDQNMTRNTTIYKTKQ